MHRREGISNIPQCKIRMFEPSTTVAHKASVALRAYKKHRATGPLAPRAGLSPSSCSIVFCSPSNRPHHTYHTVGKEKIGWVTLVRLRGILLPL